MATIADLVIKLSANTAPAEKDMKSFSGKVHRSFGKALLPAVGVLGGLAIAGKKAADAASNLGESQNAVNVVFGDSSKKLAQFAKVADTQAGLSMRQFNELVTPIGASLINMGDSQDVAAQKSINLAKRAADMASVFNVDVKDALGAIQAGLRGEADPLERFGVGLSDAAVRAKAVQMGLAKTAAQVDAAGKSQARYALLMDQTNKLQGDFVNTSDGVANAARINAAQQENLTATMGKGLLPVFQTYQSLIRTATQFMAEHTTTVKIVVGVLAGLATAVIAVNVATTAWTAAQKIATVATKVWTAVQWLLNAALTANPIGLVIVALVALGAAIVVLWKKSETFRTIVIGTWNAIKSATVAVWNFIKDFLQKWWPLVLIIMTGGLGAIAVLIIKKWDTIKGITVGAWNAIKAVVTGAVDGVRSAVSGVFGTLAAIVKAAVGPVKAGVSALVGVFDGILDILGRIAGAAGTAMSAIDRVAGAAGKIGSIAGKIGGAIPGFASGVRNFGGGLAVVGESGPELVNLPHGSDVFSNAESTRMAGGGVTIQGDLVVREELDIERIGAMITRRLSVVS